MPKYGEAAVAAAQMVSRGRVKHAPDAWEAAVKQIFPDRLASQRKGCPRGTFLGLCESGLVKGVPGGSYTRARLNKQYAVDAVQLLRERPALANDPDQIWHLVIGRGTKVENSQMDVVVTLWQRGLIA
ncbi:MAG: DUF6979 family protein [Bryobacteraceae bacterium]